MNSYKRFQVRKKNNFGNCNHAVTSDIRIVQNYQYTDYFWQNMKFYVILKILNFRAEFLQYIKFVFDTLIERFKAKF